MCFVILLPHRKDWILLLEAGLHTATAKGPAGLTAIVGFARG
jgi:hypothetical protein